MVILNPSTISAIGRTELKDSESLLFIRFNPTFPLLLSIILPLYSLTSRAKAKCLHNLKAELTFRSVNISVNPFTDKLQRIEDLGIKLPCADTETAAAENDELLLIVRGDHPDAMLLSNLVGNSSRRRKERRAINHVLFLESLSDEH